jgi:glucoamylase
MDEVSYPNILAWQLGRTDEETFKKHIKPAAEFVIGHGPATPQERWEEKGGYSPSTIAAEIAGLICAADIARMNGDEPARARWTEVADDWAKKLPQWTVTHTGKYGDEYYIRIAQKGEPDLGGPIDTSNGGGMWDEREIVDAGFLELVRLGIVPPQDPLITKSLEVIDKVIKVDTPNGPGWYRYNHDGYGEKSDGKGWDGTGIGRLWVFFAGERGEYELASGHDAHVYLDTMQKMANAGGMLAEQVWDRTESPKPWLEIGQGTGSATPLAWTNAQFIRLAIALHDGKLPELPAVVRAHFQE